MATMMMDKVGMPSMNGMAMPSTPNMMPGMNGMNMMMVPSGTIRMEKCEGGMKMMCHCEDMMAASALQSLCKMLAGTMCSCCMMMNGMMVCGCNLMMGMCKTEMTEGGVTITCTSGDMECCKMIQACCDCMMAMMDSGCTCCVMMNNMPICCGNGS